MGDGRVKLVGRDHEWQAVDSLFAAAKDGRSGTLVIRGEAGIGKSAILSVAGEAAEGFVVLQVAGVEAEQDIGFGALHRLLIPMLDRLDSLPTPQRRALDATFGRVDGSTPDRFLIGLATLTLLAEASVDTPILAIVDDAQWIDGESRDLLTFIARRLFAERIVLLIAVRDPPEVPDAFAGLEQMSISGLDSSNARRLLESLLPRPLDAVTTSRLVEETQGNPLALVELARGTAIEASSLGLLPDEPLPLGSRLEAIFERQVRVLPEATQQFLLVAAAEPTHVDLVWKAAGQLGLHADAADAAIAAGLFDPRRVPAFRHPLIRSAAYAAANASDRRRVHRVLAELIDPASPDARAWHRAAAAAGPDEEVAAELEQGAIRAESRGGWSARAAFLARAADLTPDSSRRTERLLAAAEAALVAGKVPGAEALLDRASGGSCDPSQVAHVRRIEAALLSFTQPGKVPATLLEAARTLETLDPGEARTTYIEALQACLVSSQLTAGTAPAQVGLAALRLGVDPGQLGTIEDAMLEGYATRFAIGYAEAVPAFRRVVQELCSASIPPAGLTRWSILGANAAADMWDAQGYRDLCVRLERAERTRGALESLHITLGTLAHSLMWAGDFAGAESAHSEATEIAVVLGSDAATFDALKIELFAWQGRDEDTRFIAELLTGEFVKELGGGVAMNLARVALSILDLAQGRYEEALVNAHTVVTDDPCPHGSQALPDVVEAAVRTGEDDIAHHALDRLRERAQASGTSWGLGLLARSEALIASDPESYFRRALELLGETYVKTDLARAHLLYGEWLRRETRRTDARRQLRTAFNMFDSMGASAFAERARRELAATGEGTHKRSGRSFLELTPQERQIALLAANGATNLEIAGELFLSAATIDYHLRKVFRKLSIGSRRQLASKLRSGGPEAPQPERPDPSNSSRSLG